MVSHKACRSGHAGGLQETNVASRPSGTADLVTYVCWGPTQVWLCTTVTLYVCMY